MKDKVLKTRQIFAGHQPEPVKYFWGITVWAETAKDEKIKLKQDLPFAIN